MVTFVGSFDKVSQLPQTQFPEYAFIGRSNVGKSSLINAIADQAIARTSKTPGRTQSLNLFNFDDKLMLVDLPGYGYAKVARQETLRWLLRLEEYLLDRRQLTRLFILIDSRIGPKMADFDLMEFCDINGISYQIVMTKKDKKEKEKNKRKINPKEHPAMVEEILETSASKKFGIERMREIIDLK